MLLVDKQAMDSATYYTPPTQELQQQQQPAIYAYEIPTSSTHPTPSQCAFTDVIYVSSDDEEMSMFVLNTSLIFFWL